MEDLSAKTEEEKQRILDSAAQRFAEVLISYLEETDTDSINE